MYIFRQPCSHDHFFPLSQVALHYNLPTPTDSTTLSIQVKTEVDCNSNSLRPRVTLNLESQ